MDNAAYIEGSLLVLGLFITNVLGFVAMQHHKYWGSTAGLKLQAAVRGALVRTVLTQPRAKVRCCRIVM